MRALKPGVIEMAISLLELARHYDVLVVLSLFDGRSVRDAFDCDLIEDAEV